MKNPATQSKRATVAVGSDGSGSTSGKRTDDAGVERQYFHPAPNPMFSEEERAATLFVRYKEAVPCAVTGRRTKHHWTSQVRFKAARMEPGQYALRFGKWLKAGTPVLRDCIMQPDMAEFMRKLRAARKSKNEGSQRGQ